MAADLHDLEARLGYEFHDRDLLVRAVTHRSFSSEAKSAGVRLDNEQLEFFGDSILGFVMSEALVCRHPGLPEGHLSRAKGFLVSARWLSQVAQRIGLGEYLHLGRGEELGGGRVKGSLLANALEALIAALYLDGGLDPARRFILAHVYAEPATIGFDAEVSNYKGRLWELTGASKLPKPEYIVLETSGPPHAPSFLVEARVGSQHSGRGEGRSRKAAEQQAARALLEEIEQVSPLRPIAAPAREA